MKVKILFLALFYGTSSLAQNLPVSDNILKQSELRQATINRQLEKTPNKPTTLSVPRSQHISQNNHSICFPIKKIDFNVLGNTAPISDFYSIITNALNSQNLTYQKITSLKFELFEQPHFIPCLSLNDIRMLNTTIQNNIITKGWITSRLFIPNQSLTDRTLEFSLMQGLLNNIVIDKNNIEKTYANRANLFTAFPNDKNKPLNLRDLEQGLDNLRRLQTVKAEINIIPSTQQNMSDVKVLWQQQKYPIRVNFSFDDSGSKSTGKYLGTISIVWDNPLHLNDILSVSYTHNLTSGKKATDPNGKVDKGKTSSYSIGYSVPFGYWLVDMGINHYFYDQAVIGVNRNYHYTGTSNQAHLNLSKVIYRDNQHKITAQLGGWFKENKSYIDDVEIDVQHHRTAGWQANISSHSYFKLGTLISSLTYKRGTRAFNAITAPEELFNEGTAKSKIWIANIDWQMPFKVGHQQFSWHSQLQGQFNQTALTIQDNFSIGSRYNVRGFTGEQTLSAEQGWYLRNDIVWQYNDNHRVYLGLDVGKVFGDKNKNLVSDTLSGMTLGFNGQYKHYGNWHYDLFISTPLKKPTKFDTDKVVTGFNISYSF
ncbi:ShlB/FhaC/HecB family hemolysin secretion/activation protein [Pasteurella atlantica]|uniref:ShlB/FhaC/HecB family hemolysin secretion/activation protein n=1 Tax=Pasteurellaceae TaxID=712 RepID=UPI00276C1513|nr:ShlB/FhaC/HecB family hemolysin secretion/activation protein [Pasteurella atlantica]MDP8099221.1 ShlB/FhaC/HecB family hemolysin secretion/activation protein [Pasteurella atlantica]MDP8106220.1 ShlB/FhaC/HecB family hemolysin secretion/activation protein [Pasteurella atlantica]MDP8115945.1 ShlB/FhaC/HecB family hemolysin secretion/activation protein [Pasteurella atlantica]